MITIIITNYNKGSLLRKAVTSAINQTHKDLEIIVIDDDSSDDPLQILNDISDPRISIYKNTKNCGAYACRNFAIDNSSGEYITFLDADDYIKEDHIELLLKKLMQQGCNAVNSTYKRRDEQGRVVESGLCEPGILFHRSVVKDIGYFHMVRMGADSEYRNRLKKSERINKKNRTAKLHNCTYFALRLPNSLTTNNLTGGKSQARKDYVAQWSKSNKLYYHYSESMDFFKLPPEALTIPLDFSNFKKLK